MGVVMYYGAAGGAAQKALRKMGVENVLISYVTRNNRPWDGIERLFIDSGGYSALRRADDYQTADAEYLDFLREQPNLRYYALRDYPVDQDTLDDVGRTVADHQRMTTDRHVDLLDRIDDEPVDGAEPVAVLQGRTLDDYLAHADALKDAGALTTHVAIGSLVGRPADQVAAIVDGVRAGLWSTHTLHGLGVSRDVLAYPEVVDALDTADSCAYERRASYDAQKRGESCDYRLLAFHWFKFDRRINDLIRQAERDRENWRQATLDVATDGGPR